MNVIDLRAKSEELWHFVIWTGQLLTIRIHELADEGIRVSPDDFPMNTPLKVLPQVWIPGTAYPNNT